MMNNYNKLKNNFDEIGLLTFNQNLDYFIDKVNSGELSFIDSLYETNQKEKDFWQEIVDRAMIKTAHFPFIKTFDDYDFSFRQKLKKEEILDLKIFTLLSKMRI